MCTLYCSGYYSVYVVFCIVVQQNTIRTWPLIQRTNNDKKQSGHEKRGDRKTDQVELTL